MSVLGVCRIKLELPNALRNKRVTKGLVGYAKRELNLSLGDNGHGAVHLNIFGLVFDSRAKPLIASNACDSEIDGETDRKKATCRTPKEQDLTACGPLAARMSANRVT